MATPSPTTPHDCDSGLDWLGLSARQGYQFGLLPLVIWLEARNQPYEAMVAVGWVVRNRVESPKWWGWDFPSVILKHYSGTYQFSSFDEDDPNSEKFPKGHEPAWAECLRAAAAVFTRSVQDPTGAATHYHDHTIRPPGWTKGMTKTAEIGAFSFYK